MAEMAEEKVLLDCVGERIAGVQDYALIGNLRTAALVSKTGSIESMCVPYFDSPSVFARVVDADKGKPQ
jgi:GH15 family glucan-1,4-alpha-glucosidase